MRRYKKDQKRQVVKIKSAGILLPKDVAGYAYYTCDCGILAIGFYPRRGFFWGLFCSVYEFF